MRPREEAGGRREGATFVVPAHYAAAAASALLLGMQGADSIEFLPAAGL